jgi:hypothetical protein
MIRTQTISTLILTVYDDFATSEASVTHGSTNDEITTGVNVIFGVSVNIFGRNDRFDDFFEDILTKSRQCDLQKESNMSKKCQNHTKKHKLWMRRVGCKNCPDLLKVR